MSVPQWRRRLESRTGLECSRECGWELESCAEKLQKFLQSARLASQLYSYKQLLQFVQYPVSSGGDLICFLMLSNKL